MMEAVYRKSGLKISHVWFANNLIRTKSDVTLFHGMESPSQKINQGGYYEKVSRQSTLITDLSSDIEALWSSIKKNTRYEIRRAEKEGVTVRFYMGEELPNELMDSFERVYNQMYSSKGLISVFNRKLVNEYCEKGMIAFSIASFQDEPLVFHSYIYDESNCRFFYSCSPFRDEKEMASLIGRMNRFLHWEDFKFFKEHGIVEYDWGGINSIEEPNSIAQFKMAFGGAPIDRYNYIIANTIKGKIAYLIKYR